MNGSDEELLAALRGSEAECRRALAWLYENHAESLRRYFQAQRLSRDEAEDRVQDTFVNVMRNIGSFRGDSRFSSWMWAIARNELLMFLRSAKRREDPAGDALPEQVDETGEASGLFDNIQDCVQDALARFEREFRDYAQVIRLVSLYEWSTADVATFLGKRPGATREYLSQSRKRFAPFVERCLEYIRP